MEGPLPHSFLGIMRDITATFKKCNMVVFFHEGMFMEGVGIITVGFASCCLSSCQGHALLHQLSNQVRHLPKP